jgi:hypothetical protein
VSVADFVPWRLIAIVAVLFFRAITGRCNELLNGGPPP